MSNLVGRLEYELHCLTAGSRQWTVIKDAIAALTKAELEKPADDTEAQRRSWLKGEMAMGESVSIDRVAGVYTSDGKTLTLEEAQAVADKLKNAWMQGYPTPQPVQPEKVCNHSFGRSYFAGDRLWEQCGKCSLVQATPPAQAPEGLVAAFEAQTYLGQSLDQWTRIKDYETRCAFAWLLRELDRRNGSAQP